MKLYLKIVTPLFTFVMVYSFLSIFLGPKGFFALQQLKQQRDTLVHHVQMLSETGEHLNIKIANLASDPDTIAVHAHELGYVHQGEGLIKLLHFSGLGEQRDNAGEVYAIQQPQSLSDTLCKSIAVFIAAIVLVFEIVIGQGYAYFKKRS